MAKNDSCSLETSSPTLRTALGCYHRCPTDLRCHPAQPVGMPTSSKAATCVPSRLSVGPASCSNTDRLYISLDHAYNKYCSPYEEPNQIQNVKIMQDTTLLHHSCFEDHIPQISCHISPRWLFPRSLVLVRWVFSPLPALLFIRNSSYQRGALARVPWVPEQAGHAVSHPADDHPASQQDFLHGVVDDRVGEDRRPDVGKVLDGGGGRGTESGLAGDFDDLVGSKAT